MSLRPEHPVQQIARTNFAVTDDLLLTSPHLELRVRGICMGAVGHSDLHGWWAAVQSGNGWNTLDRSGSDVQARQRVHAVVGRGRWVRVESADDVAW